MARFILELEPGVAAAQVQQQIAQVQGVVDSTAARSINAVIVSAQPEARRRLAEQANVAAVHDDIQALPQIAGGGAQEEFLQRVRELRGEENLPPLFQVDSSDDNLMTDGGNVALPVEEEAEARTAEGPIENSSATVDFVDVPQAHAAGVRGKSVIAVVLDTGGCAENVADERMMEGADLTEENDPWSPLGSGHGMMSAGIFAGGPETGGIETGVAPGAMVFPIKSTLAASEIIQAQDIILDLAEDNPDKAVVVNNSWAFVACTGICDHPVTSAVDEVAGRAGVYQVFAAGNQGGKCGQSCDGSDVGISGPNSLSSVLTVGATGADGEPQALHAYSSRGATGGVSCGEAKPDVTAPVFGRVPWGCTPDGRDLGNGVGTSAAAPAAAGIVALALDQAGTRVAQDAVFAAVRNSAQGVQGQPPGCVGQGNVTTTEVSVAQRVSGGLSAASLGTAAGAALSIGVAGAAVRERFLT